MFIIGSIGIVLYDAKIYSVILWFICLVLILPSRIELLKEQLLATDIFFVSHN